MISLTAVIGVVILAVLVGGGCSSDTEDLPAGGAAVEIDSATAVGGGETTITANTENDSITSTSLDYSGFDDERYAAPSLERRVFASDVVVHAEVIGEYAGGLKFRAHEYLKGTGGDQFFVRVRIEMRDVQWDDQPAVLLLQEPDVVKAYNQAAIAGGAPSEFYFSSIPWRYRGDREWSYSIGGINPLWLPLATTSSDLSLNSPDREFITESETPLGKRHPTVTLGELREMIEWLHDGSGVAGYEQCISSSIDHIDFYRNWEALFGEQFSEDLHTLDIDSGLGANHVLLEFGSDETPQYNRVWLTGPDAEAFLDVIVDNDDSASNGYEEQLKTARPLPRGSYELTSHIQTAGYIPCKFTPEFNMVPIEVTVTAPNGTVHEAFFDPVALAGGVVGADTSGNGVLRPQALTFNGTTSALESLSWQSGKVTLALVSGIDLSGLNLDFINLNGNTALSLNAGVAPANSTKKTYTWPVPDAPWAAGDLLMIRLRDASTTVTPVTPTATPGGPTPTPVPPTATPVGPTPTPVPPTPTPVGPTPTPMPPTATGTINDVPLED